MTRNLPILSPQERAFNLKLARRMTGLTVEELVKKYASQYKISSGTWVGWEGPLKGGLSQRGAAIATELCAREGVFFNPQWLYYNIGAGPRLGFPLNDITSKVGDLIEKLNQAQQLATDFKLFKQSHPDAISFIVEDDSMMPRFIIGEYVAGIPFIGQSIQKLLGHDCIVQTTEGELLLRQLNDYDHEQETYTLICCNVTTTHKKVMTNVKLSLAAGVIWQRRQLIDIK